jgi:hypothetical protein
MPAKPDLDNYFNYFTEIEEHFQKRRGTILLLSTLDWALIETWKDASIPLEAVLRGIDTAFDHYDKRPSKARKVNSIAYCSQEVLAAAEQMKEAAVGTGPQQARETGFDAADIASFLKRNAELIRTAKLPDSARQIAEDTVRSLRDLASGVDVGRGKLEDLERRLTVMEEKLFAVLLAGTADEKLVEIRAQADREIAPYRSKMAGPQIEQLHRQYVHKMLLERHGIPRLSLFYM